MTQFYEACKKAYDNLKSGLIDICWAERYVDDAIVKCLEEIEDFDERIRLQWGMKRTKWNMLLKATRKDS